MHFMFDDNQRELAEVSRRYFATGGPLERIDSGPAAGREAWQGAVDALGVHLLGVPEELGGLGGTVGLAAVLEEAGRGLYPAPLLTSVGYANGLLIAAGGLGHDLLREALDAGRALSVIDDVEVLFEGGALAGTAAAVTDVELADDLLVVTNGQLLHVPVLTPGLRVEEQEGIDPSRRAARVTFEGVRPTLLAADVAEPLEIARARAQGLAAVEAVGGMRASLDAVVEHVSTRRQFGVPVGTFQAVQHKAVDMLLELDRAAAGAYHAAWCADAEPETLSWAGPLALSTAATAYGRIARTAIQLLGGIGFTWEHHAHRHFRRAAGFVSQFGGADGQLDEVFAASGMGTRLASKKTY